MTNKVETSVYLTPETRERINTDLEDAGNTMSQRIGYCVRQELQRREAEQ